MWNSLKSTKFISDDFPNKFISHSRAFIKEETKFHFFSIFLACLLAQATLSVLYPEDFHNLAKEEREKSFAHNP